MPSDLERHVTFDEWALDVTQMDSTGAYAFVPICGEAVVLGYTVISDRSPGPLTAVISESGLEHARQWADRNPTWRIDYGNTSDLSTL